MFKSLLSSLSLSFLSSLSPWLLLHPSLSDAFLFKPHPILKQVCVYMCICYVFVISSYLHHAGLTGITWIIETQGYYTETILQFNYQSFIRKGCAGWYFSFLTPYYPLRWRCL